MDTPTKDIEAVKKRVHVETWGCQMNVADSENMLALLAKENYELVHEPENADLVLLNTCHIREKARHKVVSRLGRLKQMKDIRPDMRIAVAGCVVQAEGKKLAQEVPYVDVWLGPGKIDELPNLLKQNESTAHQQLSIGFHKEREHAAIAEVSRSQIPTISGKNEVSRYVNITQGCDNFCTFCVVPFTRGREISRLPQDIMTEVQTLLDDGAEEVTLLGQNVNSYGNDFLKNGKIVASAEGAFVDLLKSVAALPRLKRLRFTTSNPHDFTRPLADLFASEPKMGRYMHLPVQSGDDVILERMRRKVTVAEYYERIAWLREAHSDMAISTDLIVGFPGETEEQFQGTLDLVEKVRFSFVFAFKYSSRKGTAAARFPDHIEDAVATERLARLNVLQNQITLAQNDAEIGKDREVLFLYESRKDAGHYYGRTEHFRLVKVASNRDIVGKMLPVKIESANKTALIGRLL